MMRYLRSERWIMLVLAQLVAPVVMATAVWHVAADGALGGWYALLVMVSALLFNQTVTPRMPPLDRPVAAAALLWALAALPGAPAPTPADPVLLVSLAAAAALATAASLAYLARRESGREAVLRFPFDSGRLMALQAGSSRLTNAHRACLSNPQIRGQSFAVDFVALGPLGTSAGHGRPRRLEHFPIYGMPVLSPAAGLVTRVQDHLPDQAIGAADRDRPLGNHIWIEWHDGEGPVEALLAHLRPGSVAVRPGERVRPGQRVASVGNSGNSSEPHLHLHMQRKAPAHSALEADPVPIRFEGFGVPYRNMVVDLRG